MQIDEGGVVRRLRVAVRHAHDYRFLQAEHVAEVLGETSKQRQLRGAGVAEDRSHPEGTQQLQDCGADSHRDFSVLHEAWRGHRHGETIMGFGAAFALERCASHISASTLARAFENCTSAS